MRASAAMAGPALPPVAARRDPVFVAIAILSLAAHLAVILAIFLRREEPVAPREIPVEFVQMPAAAPQPKGQSAPQPMAKPADPPKSAPQPQKQVAQPKRAEPRNQPEHTKQAEQKAAEQKKAPERKKAPEPKTPPDKKMPADNKATAEQQDVSQRLERLLGAMPAIALPGAADTGTDEVFYKLLVLSQVAKSKREGRSIGIPGAASVSFTLGDAGDVVRCEIVHKSADPKLDDEAMAMVHRGAPYPPPPPDADRDFVITLRFDAMP